MKKYLLLGLLLSVMLIFGCKTTQSTSSKSTSKPVAPKKSVSIFVLVDRGIKANMNGFIKSQYNSVGLWMEKDLVRALEKTGYKPYLIQNRKAYKRGPGKYLLKVTITNFGGGAPGVRMGWRYRRYRSDAETLDTRYELFGRGSKPFLAKTHGTSSSRGWRRCAKKLNEDTVQAVTERLNKIK
jgi:hypothetical protein